MDFGLEFLNILSLDSESASLRYYGRQFSDKTGNFEFLGLNLPKTGFWDRNFKNGSLDSESTTLRYYVLQFSDETVNFEFFSLKVPKSFWGVGFSKIKLWIRNQQSWDTACPVFKITWTTFNFCAQIWPKVNFGVEILKI